MKSRYFAVAIPLLIGLSPAMKAAPSSVVEFVSSTTNQSQFIAQPPDATVYPFVAGQNMIAGAVTAFTTNTGEFVVTYEATGVWSIRETHLELALTPGDLPQTNNGNPKPGQFDYGGVQAPGTKAVQYVFKWGGSVVPGSDVYLGAHGVVVGVGAQTAWSAGFPFSGKNWFTYSKYTRPAPSRELVVSKSFSPTTQQLDQPGEFSIEVTNNGSDVAGNVEISDTLDDLFGEPSAFVSSGNGVCSVDGSALSCTFPSLQPGETATVVVSYHLMYVNVASGSILNCATARDSDGNTAQGCATLLYVQGPG